MGTEDHLQTDVSAEEKSLTPLFVLFVAVAAVPALVAYRLTSADAEDYYLAGRTLGTVVLLFTTFATLLSAFTFFGGPNLAYSAGPEWILVMGLMDGILFAVLWYVVGYKQWLVGRAHGYVTLGEMLGDRFGSTGLRVLVAAIGLFWLFPYVMLQQRGAGIVLESLTNGAVPYWAGAGGITLFMILYVVLSGMRGVAWTDTLQGAFMLLVTWAAFLWVLASVGGLASATGALAANQPEFLALGGGLYSPEWVLSTAISIAFGVAIGVLLVNGAYAQASLASLRLERSIPERGEVERRAAGNDVIVLSEHSGFDRLFVQPLDGRRKLVLIKRDDREHLIILGQNTETVVETRIGAGGSFAQQLERESGT